MRNWRRGGDNQKCLPSGGEDKDEEKKEVNGNRQGTHLEGKGHSDATAEHLQARDEEENKFEKQRREVDVLVVVQ